VGNVSIRAKEDAQQIAAAYDAEQLALRVDDRQPPDVMRVHQPRRARDGHVGMDRDGRSRHQRACGQAGPPGLAQPPALGRARVQPGLAGRHVLCGEQIGLGDHSGYEPAHHQHRHAVDLMPGQQAGDLLVRGNPVDGHP
jgi:hypothetical protein